MHCMAPSRQKKADARYEKGLRFARPFFSMANPLSSDPAVHRIAPSDEPRAGIRKPANTLDEIEHDAGAVLEQFPQKWEPVLRELHKNKEMEQFRVSKKGGNALDLCRLSGSRVLHCPRPHSRASSPRYRYPRLATTCPTTATTGGQEVRRSGGQEVRRSGGQEVRRSGCRASPRQTREQRRRFHAPLPYLLISCARFRLSPRPRQLRFQPADLMLVLHRLQ
jgi:hypothetical protein